ncbi:hypothetical protein D0860_05245 [Hortaea werneckii]|uniref:Prefoldin subunit 2 n=1 Tax=Hortaea werneckii TaxID=91943 RepID=A0A3M7H1N0_HORWE|nr:hypothetical protein D0860_05245 [Hortaea werneckii]RMZ33006.1 hypothetical protein D0859_02879 [Hortaea werneckii]
MAEKTLSAKKQQELQVQYSNYKDTLQAIAQKIGDVEQEGEEHKLLTVDRFFHRLALSQNFAVTQYTSAKPSLTATIGSARWLSYGSASKILHEFCRSWVYSMTHLLSEKCVREDKVSPANTSVRLVLETLTPLPGDRKCFRMINGVLVERTVSEVLPALQTNAEGLKKVLEDLVKQYRTKQEDMDKWKVRMLLISLYNRTGF